MEDRRTRPPLLALFLALIAALMLAAPTLAAADTKDLTVDPGATQSASGFTDLQGMTYSQAKDRLDQLSQITLPVHIPGLERLGASGVAVGANDAGHSLSLSGSATVLGHDANLLVTAVWPDDASTAPVLAVAAKTSDVSLSQLNPRWDATYGDVRFSSVRLAVASADEDIDPAALPAAARDFYAAPTHLTGGVNLAGDLTLSGRLADAFGYAGYSGDVHVEGSLAASAAALFGHASDADLGDLDLKATLGKSPTAPAWVADRTSTYELALTGGHPSVSVDEDVTLAIGGTTNHFTGHVAIAPGGDVSADLGLVGDLDAPFGLDAAHMSDVKLHLGNDGGALEFTVDGVHVTAAFDGDRATFTADGPLTATQLADLGGKLLGTPVAALPGGDSVSLDHVSFSFDAHTFSVTASTTVHQMHASALLTLRKQDGGPAQPLLGLRVTDPVTLSSLLPSVGDTLGGIQLPAFNLTATSLTSLAATDMTPQEHDFFAAAYPSLPARLTFTPGLDLEAKLPLDTLGYAPGSQATLSGTLGANVTPGSLSSASLRDIALDATLPAPPAGLPGWVTPTGDTTLSLRYASGSVAASFSTAADVTIHGSTLSTTIAGRLARSGGRSTVSFSGTIANWRNPFGVSWLPTIGSATVELDTSFGGGRPADVNASISAALPDRHLTLGFAIGHGDATTAALTARYDRPARLSEVMSVFPDLARVGTLPPDVAALGIDGVSASLQVGRQASAFALKADTHVAGVGASLLVAVRPGADGGFSLGIKPQKDADVGRLLPSRAPGLTLHSGALVLGDAKRDVPVSELTDPEFDFYKSLYGCAAGATKADCPQFATLDVQSGLRLLAGFDIDPRVASQAAAIGIQTSGHGLLEGTVPVLGSGPFALKATLGDLRIADAPDWFDHADVALEIGSDGLKFDGDLGVKILRNGASTCSDGGMVINGRCYDRLDFTVSAGVALAPKPSITLTGKLTTQHPWRHAFGQDWLQISRAALELGVAMGPDGPAVTMGFQGDVDINGKDVAAALKVALKALPGPPGVRPDLIGFSAASHAGLSLSDLMWLSDKLTGTHLTTANLPDVSLRNLYLEYSQEDDPNLCLTQGVHFNADLYVGSHLPAVDPGTDDPNGCRKLDTDPSTRQTCLDRQAEGCLASVYGRFDTGGIVAGGEVNAFHLGPISLDNSSLALALTPSEQSLSLHGGATIGSDTYTFAKGSADLDVSRNGFAFAGDAALFGGSTHGYLQASSRFDLQHPAFTVKAWLRADADAAISSDLGAQLQKVQPAITALGQVLNVIQGGGSVANVRDLPTLLTNAGATVPWQVTQMANVLGNFQDQAQHYGFDVTLGRLLNGFSFGVDGTTGWWTPDCIGYKDDNGHCWGISVTPRCVNVVVNGKCYFTPPATVSVGGICPALGIGNCSWSSLMAYVRPALSAAFTKATGMTFSDSSLSALINGLAGAAGSLVNVDCAYFSADGSALAKGELNVALAAKLRVFGQPLQFGDSWDFSAHGGSPATVLENLLGTLFNPSSGTCPPFPAGHDQPAAADPGATLSSGEVTTADEGGTSTLSATFAAAAVHYPAVKVDWGDGTTAVIPGGESRTVTATHAYAQRGAPVSVYTVTAKVADSGGAAKVLSAKVRNVAPTFTALGADPVRPVEGGPVTIGGTLTDPGATDPHTLQITWGDGSAPGTITLAPGAKQFAVGHRYLNDGSYHATVRVSDDDGGSTATSVAVAVANAAPTDVRLKTPGATPRALVTYPVYFADAGTLDPHTVNVDWGDGGKPDKVQLPAGTTHVDLPHAYAAAGAYSAQVTVSDERGAQGQATVPVTVR